MDGCYDSLPGNARKRQKFLLRNVTFYIADEVRAIRTKYSVMFLIVALSFKICILNWFVKADKKPLINLGIVHTYPDFLNLDILLRILTLV